MHDMAKIDMLETSHTIIQLVTKLVLWRDNLTLEVNPCLYGHKNHFLRIDERRKKD